jgi:hypothetical protein
MIFLCHLSKDERVLQAMLDAARGLFTETPQYNVKAESEFLTRVKEEVPKLVLKHGDTNQNRQQMLEHQDELKRRATGAIPKDEFGEISEPDAEITPLLQHNAAFKTIQILGQVLKNFTGSLKGGPKRELVEECYGLGLRVLGSIFKLAETGLPELIEALVAHAKSGAKPPPREKIEVLLQHIFFGLMHAIVFSVFKHISNSVGTEKVSQTFAEVAAKVENPSVEIIDLSIRLDHYRQFPLTQIELLAKKYANNYFATSLIRYLVWYHLYLFPVDYQQKQSVCQTLAISLEQQTKLLAPGPKKTNIKRDRKDKNAANQKRKKRR